MDLGTPDKLKCETAVNSNVTLKRHSKNQLSLQDKVAEVAHQKVYHNIYRK